MAKTLGKSRLKAISAIELVDDEGTELANPAPWGVSGKDITYDATKRGGADSVSVQFVAQSRGFISRAISSPRTEKRTLTINFVDRITDPFAPEDIVAVANDRTTAVTIPVPEGFELVNLADDGKEWAVADDSGVVTFTPSNLAAGLPLASARFRLREFGEAATVVVLFPPVPLSEEGGRLQEFKFAPVLVTADGISAELTLGSDEGPIGELPATATVNGSSVTVGTWSVKGSDKGVISFTPNGSLTDSVNRIDPATFALLYKGTRSNDSSVTLTLPQTGTPPVATEIAKVTANRGIQRFSINGAILTGDLQPSGGTWSVNQAGTEVLFTPSPGLSADESTVTVSYNLPGATAQPANLSITFLPAPPSVTKAGVSRRETALVSPLSSLTINSKFSLMLWTGTEATNQIDDTNRGGIWTVTEQNQITFSPTQVPLDPNGPNAMETTPRPFAADSLEVAYVLVAADGTSDTPGTVTLDFDKKPQAYPFGITVLSVEGSVKIDLKDHYYSSSQLSAILLGRTGNATQQSVVGNVLEVDSLDGGNTTLTMTTTPLFGKDSYSFFFRVVDNNKVESAPAEFTITVDPMARPQMMNFLLTDDVTGGKAVACEVLENVSSLFDLDPKSLVFVGLEDITGDGLPPDSLIAKDRRTISVPGEGAWMISDANAVVFRADDGLATPPTPAVVQVRDVEGNPSNTASIVIDPALSELKTLKATLETDDTVFWNKFVQHAAQSSPPLSPTDLLVTVAAIRGATRMHLPYVGRNPLSGSDFDAAFAAWDAAGQPVDPNDGDGSTDLVSLCKTAIADAMDDTSKPFKQRFWTLEMIARMTAHALPDDES